MASSAAHITVQTGASVHAPHGKSHQASNKSSQGDSFADMLAASDDAAPQDNARANTATSKEKSADKAVADKSTAGDKPSADAKEEPKTAEGGQANVQTDTQTADDTAAQDANALTDSLADALIDTNAANDNGTADVTIAAQTTQPAPAPQPVAMPALAVAAANIPQNATSDGTQADAADAELAPVAGANLAPAQAARPDSANAQPAGDDGKPAGAAQPTTEAATKTAGKAASGETAQAEAGDFQQILSDANLQTDAAEPAPAVADAPKPVETPAAPAAKPSPELNTITLAAPPAQPHAGAEKLVTTAQAAAPHLPQAAPDVNQFAVDIAARSQSGAKQFDIRLDPPELGRVEVRLSIDAHGKAEAHLTADQPQTLELLQKDAPALARALRDAGLNVNQDGLNFSLKNQQSHAGGEDNSRGGARAGLGGSNRNNEPRIEEAAAYVRRSLGVLDIRV